MLHMSCILRLISMLHVSEVDLYASRVSCFEVDLYAVIKSFIKHKPVERCLRRVKFVCETFSTVLL